MPVPKPHEVLGKVLAAPVNPSDLGRLFGGADMATARASTKDGLPIITADVPPAGMRAMGGRIGDALAIGNEGCGTVVAAGESPEAQALIGKTVALLGGVMYAEYRCLPVQMVMALPDGTDPAAVAIPCTFAITGTGKPTIRCIPPPKSDNTRMSYAL